jgi:hypothetical protein
MADVLFNLLLTITVFAILLRIRQKLRLRFNDFDAVFQGIQGVMLWSCWRTGGLESLIDTKSRQFFHSQFKKTELNMNIST